MRRRRFGKSEDADGDGVVVASGQDEVGAWIQWDRLEGFDAVLVDLGLELDGGGMK